MFETFTPNLPESLRNIPFVLLANIAPALQHHVLDQMPRPKFVVADTMDLWLNIALPDLLKLLSRVDGFVLNDSEAHQLTKEDNVLAALKKIHKLGPKYVIIKKGEHGSIFRRPKVCSSPRRFPWPKSWTPPARATHLSAAPGLHRQPARDAREETAPRDPQRQRRRLLLLRRLRADPDHPCHQSGHRPTGDCVGKMVRL